MNTLVVITDGRWSYLARTLTSAQSHLDFDWFDWKVLVNDSGEPLQIHLDGWTVINHPHRQGLAASVNDAWRAAMGSEFVFHLEDDWAFNEPVQLDRMASLLTGQPQLAQIVLRRQAMPVPEELAHGGFIEAHPSAYTDRGACGIEWLEHDRCFSLNPCLIPGRITDKGWPAHGHEGIFTSELVADGYRFAIWGRRADPPRVHHIGDQRSHGWVL